MNSGSRIGGLTLAMWGAIKSDLFDFISTIQVDTSKTIAAVLGDQDDEPNANESRGKLLLDIARSFSTYNNEIEPEFHQEYKRFLKKFNLCEYSSQIAVLLDQEETVDVSRYYADLVPALLTPDKFWSRYFFRVGLVINPPTQRPPGIGDGDEEEEEELGWGEEKDQNIQSAVPVTPTGLSAEEEVILRATVKHLAARVAELERVLAERDTTILQLQQALVSSSMAVTYEEPQVIAPFDSSTTLSQPPPAASPLQPTAQQDPPPATVLSVPQEGRSECVVGYESASDSSSIVIIAAVQPAVVDATAVPTKHPASAKGKALVEFNPSDGSGPSRSILDEDDEEESWN